MFGKIYKYKPLSTKNLAEGPSGTLDIHIKRSFFFRPSKNTALLQFFIVQI